MAQTIPLKVVIELTGSQASDSVSDSEQGLVHPWPGDPVTLDITIPPTCLDPVWIGTNEDGTVVKYFPLETPIADILAEGWVHVYQGTQICDSDGNANIYSNQYNHVLLAIASCCNNSFATQVFALKQSNQPLTPGEEYPCGTEAIFKWLAIRGSAETRPNLNYRFSVQIINAALDFALENTQIAVGPLTTTTQLVLSWPQDFIGLVIDGVTLVGNNTVPGPGQMQVKDFDGGQIGMAVSIEDPDNLETVSNANEIFALPITDCGDAESSASDSGIFGSEFSEEFG